MRSARKKRLRVGMKNQRHIDAVHYIYGVLSIQHATYSVYPDFRVLSKTLSESARAVPRQAVGVCGRGVQQRCAQAGLLACRGPSGWLCRRRKQDARPRKGRAQVAPVKARSGIVLAPGGDMFVAGDIADGVVPHQRRAQPGQGGVLCLFEGVGSPAPRAQCRSSRHCSHRAHGSGIGPHARRAGPWPRTARAGPGG